MYGDCLERMKEIPSGSVDMILADPPYGTTQCKWDSIIPLEPMWERLKRIIKPNGAIVMTAAQPFTSILVCSNLDMFKYDWVWEKPSAKGHLNAKKQPMRAHESILVFYNKQPTYNPEMTDGHTRKVSFKRKELNSDVYNKNTTNVSYDSTKRYPRSVQLIKQDTQKCSLHPTQKPVALMEYLIKTYTNEGETVLDFTMGSGTTGVACINTEREFIGIEMDADFFQVATDRINVAIKESAQ
jgi:site-specific DNA-methyltransferase (adenine-specific)